MMFVGKVKCLEILIPRKLQTLVISSLLRIEAAKLIPVSFRKSATLALCANLKLYYMQKLGSRSLQDMQLLIKPLSNCPTENSSKSLTVMERRSFLYMDQSRLSTRMFAKFLLETPKTSPYKSLLSTAGVTLKLITAL